MVILCNTALVFAASGTYSDPYIYNDILDINSVLNTSVYTDNLSDIYNYMKTLNASYSESVFNGQVSALSSYISSNNIQGEVVFAGTNVRNVISAFVFNNGYIEAYNTGLSPSVLISNNQSSGSNTYIRWLTCTNSYVVYDKTGQSGQGSYLPQGKILAPTKYYITPHIAYSYIDEQYLYYTDISNVESFTNSDGVTFYTGGLSLIELAHPDFYSKLQAAAAGSAGLLDWLINDIGAMFMLDPSTNDWYILNAPQNIAYYASDSANNITLYSGTITEDNTFKRDAGSVSFGSSTDYWKHNNAVVKYNYQTQEFEYSNTFNGLTINRGANGVWINRGSSMLALDDPINEQREGLLHGRYVINNPSIGDNFDQYLDNSNNDTTVIDGDLYALLNEIKNWSQVDALTQKYLLNTLSEISSLTSEVIDYLGPNYLYPTITSYFDSLFRLNGLRYSAYDQNNNKVEYNLHNKSIGDVLTEEYLMLTSIGSDNRPSLYYQYDGDVKVNPLYSLWNDIKNLPDNIANKIQPIFPTIPGSNDTIIDSVGDYNNRVSLNPQNVTDTHENLTDLLSWFHLEGFSGSFSDIFGSSDRWSLWSEETYTNCGLEVDTEE